MSPQEKIHKRRVDLSFHRVREYIVAKITPYQLISGKINPADTLSKHWAHHCVWPSLNPLLFWKGGTMECLYDNTLEFEEKSLICLFLFLSLCVGNCMYDTCNYFYISICVLNAYLIFIHLSFV